jgi:hypothetical protein
MATYDEIMTALRNAHAAGDTAAATRLAGMAKKAKASDGMASKADAAKAGTLQMQPGSADRAAAADSIALANMQPPTNIIDQAGSGVNEGLASFAGTPVALAEMVLNGLIPPKVEGGLGPDGKPQITSVGQPQFQGSVGGPETFLNLMDPVISDVAPQTGPQRFARRVGQEVGYGVPAALTGAAVSAPARASMPAYMATSVVGDVGSGVAGQTSREIAPNNATMDTIMSLLGGVGAGGLSALATPRLAAAPSIDDLKATANAKWTAVKAAPETLTDQATTGLEAATRNALPTSQLAPEAYPKAFGMTDTMQKLKNPTIYDVEQARRIVGDRVASDPAEAGVGVAMKKEIENYLNGLTPADLQGGNADQALADLAVARKTTHQVKKADVILNKEMRGETRAATTGTGGNEVNATRQNIRTVYDKERDPTLKGQRQGFTPDEMAAMERVVMGSPMSNIARALGRMAPTSNALSMMTTGWGGAAGLGAATASGNPLMLIPAAAGGVGMAAKATSEALSKRQIANLLSVIQNGGKAPAKSAARSAAEAAILQQLLATATNKTMPQ